VKPGRLFLALLAATAGLAVPAPVAAAATYHVSPSGDDAAAGSSPAQAWRTLARANAQVLAAGDALLLEGGATFAGTVELGADERGMLDDPIVVGSYGRGRATIESGTASGFFAYNTAGIVVRDLYFEAGAGNGTEGLVFYSDLPDGTVLTGVRVERVEVAGYGKYGVSIGSWNGLSSFEDVTVSAVHAHHNRYGGIIAGYGQAHGLHRRVRVHGSRVHDSPGVPGERDGDGIVLGNVAGGRVDHNLVSAVGQAVVGRPIGAYASRGVVIERNEAWGNFAPAGSTTGAITLEWDLADALVQHNFTHDNEGSGVLVRQGHAAEHGGHVVRHNVSQDDSRRSGRGALLLMGDQAGSLVHHNTVFVSPPAVGSPAALELAAADSALGDLRVQDNVLMTTGGLPLVAHDAAAGDTPRLAGNAYAASGGSWSLRWAGSSYAGLAAWRDGTGQERLAGHPTGTDADPGLRAPGTAQTVGDPVRLGELDAYDLRPDSSLLDAGLTSSADLGDRDFAGRAARVGRAPDVGALEAPQADLAVALRADELREGEPGRVTAEVVNAGPSEARAVRLTVSLPSGLRVEGVGPGWSCTPALECERPDALAAGARAELALRVLPAGPGTGRARVRLLAPAQLDPDPANDRASLVLSVREAPEPVPAEIEPFEPGDAPPEWADLGEDAEPEEAPGELADRAAVCRAARGMSQRLLERPGSVRVGRAARVRGQLRKGRAGLRGALVALQARTSGSGRWKGLASRRTDAAGRVTIRFVASRTRQYRLRSRVGCGEVVSSVFTVRVRRARP